MKRPILVTAMLAATMALTACGDDPSHMPAGSASGDAEPTSATVTGQASGHLPSSVPPDPTFVPSPYGELLFAEHRGRDAPAASLAGTLILDKEGCLRLAGASQGPGDTIIWSPDFDLEVKGGEVRVLDSKGGVAATAGDRVVMGGGRIGPGLSGISGVSGRTASVLEERCPGMYAFMSELEKAD